MPELSLHEEVGQELDFSGSKFLGYADFRDSKFKQKVIFNDCEFQKVDFSRSNFAEAYFVKCIFYVNKADFGGATFNKGSLFWR